MLQLPDFQGRLVRLTEERLAHILGHPEMAGFQPDIAQTLRHPQTVIRSRTDPPPVSVTAFMPKPPSAGNGSALW